MTLGHPGQLPARFVELRDGWVDAFCAARGLNRARWRPPREVTPDEALGVLRAIDEGVITVDDLGRCRPVGLRKAGQDRELIRVAKNTGIHYGIEWFSHIAAVAELILDYGWPPSHLDFETLPFDAVTYRNPSDRDPVLVSEAKKDPGEVDKLIADLRAWGAAGLVLTDGTVDRDYRKYWGLLGRRMWREAGQLNVVEGRPPDWFWAVGPGVRRAFRVELVDGAVGLEEVRRLPDFAAVTGLGG